MGEEDLTRRRRKKGKGRRKGRRGEARGAWKARRRTEGKTRL